MPLDRAARDRLASTLAAYMRGEVDNFALDDAALDQDTGDDTVTDLGAGLWYLYDDFKSHPISVPPVTWDALRRVIAFLRSELDLPQPAAPRLRWVHWRQLLAIGSLVVIAVSILMWERSTSRWWLLLPGLVVGVPWAVALGLHRRGHPSSPAPPFYPFPDEESWRRHEPLLAAERLPPYDPARHDLPIRSAWMGALMSLPAILLFIPLFAPLLTLLFLLPKRGSDR